MSTADPVIIEAALNGVTTKAHNRHVPVTAAEQAKDALACVEAGATVIHTHAPNVGAPPEETVEEYAGAYRPVVDAHPGVICYPTAGLGPTIDVRYRHVELLDDLGVIRAGYVDTGSVNLGGTGPDGLPVEPGYVYSHNFADVAHKMRVCRERGLGPNVAVFEPGFLRVVLAYHEANALPAGAFVKLYFSASGYLGGGKPLWGAPPIIEALDMYLAMIGDAPITWAVAVLGGDVCNTPIARVALERGGHLRVGLEDFDSGPPNAEQVAAAAQLCHSVGREVATVSDATRVLGLPD